MAEEEKNMIEDSLIWAVNRYLGMSRSQLLESVYVCSAMTGERCIGTRRKALGANDSNPNPPSPSSHMTQPLDVAAFGIFLKIIPAVPTDFARNNGGKMPAKANMNGVIGEAWGGDFTVLQIKASFAVAGLRPVNIHGAGDHQAARHREENSSTRRPPTPGRHPRVNQLKFTGSAARSPTSPSISFNRRGTRSLASESVP